MYKLKRKNRRAGRTYSFDNVGKAGKSWCCLGAGGFGKSAYANVRDWPYNEADIPFLTWFLMSPSDQLQSNRSLDPDHFIHIKSQGAAVCMCIEALSMVSTILPQDKHDRPFKGLVLSDQLSIPAKNIISRSP